MLVSLLKELSLVNLPNKLLRKVLFVLLLTTSTAAQALTMGDFVVNSFLDKELQAEIVVDGDSGDNLNTLEVSIASEAEFNQAGILRSPLLDQFEFKLVKQSDNKVKILVTTENEVTEPYIHMLLKIRWNGGQLLREFTALIDPPLFSSKPADQVNAATTADKLDKEAQLKEELKEVTSAAEKSSTDTSSQEPVSTETAAIPGASSSLDSYGPVQAGESLSEIAQSIQADNPDLSIYQIMYVLFQNNQSAFIDNNINNLAKGATLEVGDLNEITNVDRQEGINFFYSQLAQWSAKNESNLAQEVASEGDDNSSSTSSQNDAETEQDLSTKLAEGSASTASSESSASEEKPEFQVAATDVQSNEQERSDASNQVITDLKSQVAELEASVESAKLENEELKETISLLESQLADSARLIELNNQELATLAAENEKASENNPLVGTTTVEEDPQKESIDTEQSQQDESTVTEASTPSAESNVTELQPEGEIAAQKEAESAQETETTSEQPASETQAPEVAKVAPQQQAEPQVVAPAQPSLVDSILDTIKKWWQFLAVGLAGLLAILYWKIRSSSRKEDTIDAFESTFTVYPENTDDIPVDESASDAKAEELINAIKAESTKVEEVVSNPAAEEDSSDTSVVSSIDMDALREATQSVNDFDVDSSDSEITKESSFLTVYNDGDVVVNADEIDPIAEAEVYIAYGREDQGEEVLLDGVKNFPDRNDIKIALLGLYAKSGKRAKFDDIYESLIDSGLEDNPEELETVEDLKKTIHGDSGDAGKGDATLAGNLAFGEDASNTDFIVSSDVNELTEIDIKSESFDISEIDFNSDTQDVPILSDESEAEAELKAAIDGDNEITLDIDVNEVTIEVDVNEETVEASSMASPTIGLDKAIVDEIDDEISINFEDETDQIESITIEVDEGVEAEIASTADTDLGLTSMSDGIDDIELNDDLSGDDLSGIEQEVSQIDFETEAVSAEKTLEIDLSEGSGSVTDAVDITAEISEISYDDEVSLTDVMELNVNDVDLASIPDDQDLSPSKESLASSLINDVDFVDEEDSFSHEVTVDLTETAEFDDPAELGDIDLELGGDQSEGSLPDGDSDPETQLDLAKVFLELDDVPGAVKILKDLTESPVVGEEAKELLAKHS